MFNRGGKPSGGGDERPRILAEMRTVLQRHVIDSWFPRCADFEHGGFFEDFDQRWRRRPSDSRMLEFQARQTRVAARFAIAFPHDSRWAEFALHGMRYLRDTMWDREHGGWYWRTTVRGEPLAGATKHAHSAAYSVETGALVSQATGERWALDHVEEGLDWFDRHSHDREYGGFLSWLTREGKVISTRHDAPAGAGELDPLGHDIGIKDVNVHGDWFEALLDLTANSDSAMVRTYLVEFGGLYLNRMTTPAGEVHYGFHRDWTPQPGPEWYGYGFQAAQRMLRAAPVLPEFPELEQRAGAIARHALRRARSKRGGYLYAGPAGDPQVLEGRDLRVPARAWWVQFEAVRVLALFAAREASPGPYSRRLATQWDFLRKELLDERYGGVYPQAASDLPRLRRPRLRQGGWAYRKAHPWKDASHDTDSLVAAIAALENVDPRLASFPALTDPGRDPS